MSLTHVLGRGPALGFNSDAQYGETRLQLSGDDRLVVFSDGLVERRGEDLQLALDRLLAVGRASPRDPEQLLDALLSELAPPDTDDVTLLALGRS